MISWIRRPPARAGKGFTLIEVLVVVAIIALLISILIPSLQAARDASKRSVCASNLHQQNLAMRSYAQDYRGFLPWRGWFSYTISEVPKEAYGTGGQNTKTLVNLALLIGKHLGTHKATRLTGREWDILYCPSTRDKYRTGEGGLSSLWDPATRFTYGGYNYALPMGKRVGAPRLEGDIYPRDVNKLDGNWVKLLKSKAGGGDPLTALPRGMQPLVIDFVIGGVEGPHRTGINAAYSDGHVRFVNHKELQNGTSGSIDSFGLWHYIMTHP
jgi:prepilin-type N-terminal cleavage/methylation domain-containing protein/prepilin-type processing-associated H-X9-DG protein